jgi:hypothetical protein
MKAKNFKISQNIYIVTSDHELDLHNNYCFCGYAYDVDQRSLLLLWRKTKNDLVPTNDPQDITLRILLVRSLEITPRDPKLPFTEDDCLHEIGFLCEKDGPPQPFISDKTPEDSWRWVFQFMSGTSIIVDAEEIEAIEKPEQRH